MAAVHPSRAHLVPQGQRHGSDLSSRGRPASPPPRRRHSPGRERSASPRQDYDRGGHREKERSRERASERERRDRDGPPDRDGRGDDRGRRRSASRERDGARRRSPEYSEYRRPPPEDRRDAAPHQAGSMYPSRGVGGGYGSTGNSGYAGNAGGGDYAESRRQQREQSTITPWPPSPSRPSRALSPERKHKSKHKSKRRRSVTPSSDDSEDDKRRRRKEKERRSSRKDQDRDDRKSRRRHDSLDRSRERRDRSEDERRERKRSRRSTVERSRTPETKKDTPARPLAVDEDDWVEKPAAHIMASTAVTSAPAITAASGSSSMSPPPVATGITDMRASDDELDDDESDDELGPQPLYAPDAPSGSKKRKDDRQYGGALLRGEGSAMAAFLQSEDGTEARIPRRGEIGLTSDQIEKYEQVGYVMSGSRHRRMNAVRIRKENQVISAEEKRGILKLQKEERERREAILREEFSSLVEEKLKVEPKK